MKPSAQAGQIPRTLAASILATGSFLWLVATVVPFLQLAPDAAEILSRRGLSDSPSAVHKAASNGDAFALSLLCERGADPGLQDSDGRTPIMFASEAGHLVCVRFLEPRSAPLAVDHEGHSALSLAVANHHPDIARFLLSEARQAGLEAYLPSGLLALAAREGDAETLANLLETGETRGLDDALSTAVERRDLEIARPLLRAGASPDVLVNGEPALLAALEDDARPVLDLLLFFGARPGLPASNGESALLRAIRGGNIDLATCLLDAGADPNQRGPESAPPLLAAMESEDDTLAALLVARGAEVKFRLPDGHSLLGRVLAEEKWDTARKLIAAGADPDAPCEGELSPMELAFRDRNLELARFLLAGGAVAHPALLFQAMDSGSSEIVDLFLDHGAPIDARDSSGDTLLGKACRTGNLDLAARLVFRGANTRLLGAEGQEPLVIAIATRQPAIVELLLNSGADPNRALREPVSEAFLDLAADKILAFYLKRDTRFAPLMVAAAVGESDTIRTLLRHGAERYPTTKGYQRYPISFAAEAKHIEAQQLLVGYDPATAEHKIRILIDLASQNATLFKDGEVALTSKVSTGTSSNPTPTGDFVITNKHRTWTSTLYHCEMPYFMRLSGAAFGMHVGYVPNYPASHGCIRMPESGASAFWKVAPVGTPVSIVDSSKAATASIP